MGRENEQICFLTFDNAHQASNNVIAYLDTEGRSDTLKHQLSFTRIELLFDDLPALLQHRRLGKEIRAIEVGDLRDDMNKVNAGMELLSEAGSGFEGGL